MVFNVSPLIKEDVLEKDVMITPMPFARPQDLGPSIAIVAKVNQIQDQLLKKHDIELYMHLNRLEIAPQIYGLMCSKINCNTYCIIYYHDLCYNKDFFYFVLGGSNENGSTQHTSDSAGTFISYSKEWEELFVNNNYLATIRLKGINGQLRSSRFRSVCWKLFLEVLPQDRSQWIKNTSELRTSYNKIKEIHITNPRKAGQQDLIINNPLSQDEGSLWNKFFQDKELRAMIEQDVTRTFPEMQYFQQENVRKILTDVLFCYARENEQLLYKQGMHELLAPIVFILHCDHQAFSHASEAAQPSEEMKVLLNPEYLEHDAYAMFTRLMKTAEHWFSTFEHDSQKVNITLKSPVFILKQMWFLMSLK
ncbi:TBC1 domain family member 5 [Meleagris gallopavo]|uniref:TBC1 domain family member 5 n=1 Tax=Meleagris gallopavo TaxID=9103 RepID=UPI000939BB94|nr:TBC1 domain family member 5 [Meleagris gallopavo]